MGVERRESLAPAFQLPGYLSGKLSSPRGSLSLPILSRSLFARSSGRIVCPTRSKIQDFRRQETPVDVFVAYFSSFLFFFFPFFNLFFFFFSSCFFFFFRPTRPGPCPLLVRVSSVRLCARFPPFQENLLNCDSRLRPSSTVQGSIWAEYRRSKCIGFVVTR